MTELDALPGALAWLDATPGGILIARLDRPHPDAEPLARVDFDSHPYGLWTPRAP